jgi:4-hydroxysphinganine ceramide fatty acyl 2-hydroxylase
VKRAGAFLRHGSNATLLVIAVLLLGSLVYLAPALPLVAIGIVVGILAFALSEYTTHRFLLHATPLSSPLLLRAQHRLHYDHHVTPDRLDLLFLPVWFALPVLALFGGIYFAITQSLALTLSLLLGSIVGVLYYEWAHYVAHIPFTPRTPAGRYMKKYHLLHHFKNERLWFGVTSPAMDFAGRTYRRHNEAEKSATTRELFGDP